MGHDDRGVFQGASQFDSGWVGAGPSEDLDQRLDAEGRFFDETQPHVLTALGPIEPDTLDVTLFACGPMPAAGGGEALLVLEHVYAAGVRSVADVTGYRSGQDSADVQWVSARSPVHLVVGNMSPDAHGPCELATVRFGLAVWDGLAREDWAQQVTGLPVFARVTLPDQASAAIAHLEPFLCGRRPWLVLEESGLRSDRKWGELLAGVAGVVLVVATDDFAGMTRAARRCRELVGAGFGDRLALGYNADPVLLMERFPLLLMEEGLPADAVRRLLIENPARALTRVQAG
jgi:hypothetical protein